jgi:hypothetical protein
MISLYRFNNIDEKKLTRKIRGSRWYLSKLRTCKLAKFGLSEIIRFLLIFFFQPFVILHKFWI